MLFLVSVRGGKQALDSKPSLAADQVLDDSFSLYQNAFPSTPGRQTIHHASELDSTCSQLQLSGGKPSFVGEILAWSLQ